METIDGINTINTYALVLEVPFNLCYDSANQLIRENNQEAGVSLTWDYDDGGNMVYRAGYEYTTGDFGEADFEWDFQYEDEDWGDLATHYLGYENTYDEIGNILEKENSVLTWEHGRELASMTSMGYLWRYTYDANGMRTSRTDGYTTYHYVYNGSSLSQVTVKWYMQRHTLDFTYDASGRPLSLTYDGTPYYYALNLQGDVMAILDGSGNVVVSYVYDAWGSIRSITGSLKDTVGYYNPLRYRGYVWDPETGIYYLESRYYSPGRGRFLNADTLVSTGQGLLGNNMFAYCGNNPVNMEDPTGEITIAALILIGSAIIGAASAGYTAYKEYQAGYDTVQIIGDSICAGFSGFCIVYTGGMALYQCYQNYCYLNALTPVTDISFSTTSSPYANLADPPDVAPGKDFTASQKNQIIQQNKEKNGGVVKSDMSGITLIPPQKSVKGVTPSPFEWQIDHIVPKSMGGTNSFSNAQVLSRYENRIKWNK